MKKGGFGKNKPVLITIVALVVLAAMILASAGRGTANWFENAVGSDPGAGVCRTRLEFNCRFFPRSF